MRATRGVNAYSNQRRLAERRTMKVSPYVCLWGLRHVVLCLAATSARVDRVLIRLKGQSSLRRWAAIFIGLVFGVFGLTLTASAGATAPPQPSASATPTPVVNSGQHTLLTEEHQYDVDKIDAQATANSSATSLIKAQTDANKQAAADFASRIGIFLWPVVTLILAFVFAPKISDILQTFVTRKFTLKVGNFLDIEADQMAASPGPEVEAASQAVMSIQQAAAVKQKDSGAPAATAPMTPNIQTYLSNSVPANSEDASNRQTINTYASKVLRSTFGSQLRFLRALSNVPLLDETTAQSFYALSLAAGYSKSFDTWLAFLSRFLLIDLKGVFPGRSFALTDLGRAVVAYADVHKIDDRVLPL